jgi:beta-lactamase class A
VALIAFLVRPADAAAGRTAGSSTVCHSSAHGALAARLTRAIQAARHGHLSTVAVEVDDPGIRLVCRLNSSWHFDSASVVKVTILGALLRQAQDQHRHLTSTEKALAWAMITRSDNGAASALWAELGHGYLQHFLNLARMTHTFLGPDGLWGVTQITASDEALLLRLLLAKNRVLDTSARNYALSLMAHVIAVQRWGVPAGAPAGLTVHVKNGWLPLDTHGWRIHSIGCFTGHGGGYSIVVLTQDNPTMAYGIATIEAIAEVINRDLNPETAPRVPSFALSPSGEKPDEPIPAPHPRRPAWLRDEREQGRFGGRDVADEQRRRQRVRVRRDDLDVGQADGQVHGIGGQLVPDGRGGARERAGRGAGVVADHEVQVVVDVRGAGVVAVQHVGRVHLAPQVVERPAGSGQGVGRPSHQHERVVLHGEGPFGQMLPPAGEGDLLAGTKAADADPQRGRPDQDVHHPGQVHLPPHARVGQQVLVDDGAGRRVAHAVERDQRGVHLLERIRAEIGADLLRDERLHLG